MMESFRRSSLKVRKKIFVKCLRRRMDPMRNAAWLKERAIRIKEIFKRTPALHKFLLLLSTILLVLGIMNFVSIIGTHRGMSFGIPGRGKYTIGDAFSLSSIITIWWASYLLTSTLVVVGMTRARIHNWWIVNNFFVLLGHVVSFVVTLFFVFLLVITLEQ